MKIKQGIYRSIQNPDLGLFLITKNHCNQWIILSCHEDGYPNSAAGTFKVKTIKDYEFVREV